jgi:serine/threonine-protein kinase
MESIGRYQILGELGRGAMGVVFRALDPAIGRPVAIKTIRLAEFTDTGERERLRERLFREAQSAGILSHPGIVTIYDVGEQDDVTYIAMEFVNGTTLEKLMMEETPPDSATALSVLHQTAGALDYAHKKGIVHRDIKPANIMLNEEHAVKITDFGVAKVAASQQLTQAGTVLGTPNYMSPEQIQGKPVDGRADQFALAVVSYEMLTGEKPFPGEHLTTVLYKIVSEEPPPPQNLNPTLGWPVAMVLNRALSKDSAKRYPSCTEFIKALEAALKTKKGWRPLPRGASQGLPTAVVGAAAAAAASRTADTTHSLPVKKRRLGLQILAAGLAGLGIVALAFVAAQRWLETQADVPQQVAQAPVSEPQGAAAEPKPEEPKPEEPKPVEPKPAEQAPSPVTPEPPKAEAPKPEASQPEASKTEGATGEAKPGEPAPAVEERAAAPPPLPVKTEPREVRGAAPAEAALQVVTSPPGARAVLDRDSSLTCTTPCSFQVLAGRHTVAVSMPGHRQELRIVEMSGRSKELFVGLHRQAGTVRVESEPSGAQIYVNNQLRSETTPATLVLPVGNYNLVLMKDGRRVEQAIDVKDGSMVRFTLQFP